LIERRLGNFAFADASGDSMFLQLSGGGREERPQRQLTDRLLCRPFQMRACQRRELRQELRAKHRLRRKPMRRTLHVTLHRVGDFATCRRHRCQGRAVAQHLDAAIQVEQWR
jgi:hypothetical protein